MITISEFKELNKSNSDKTVLEEYEIAIAKIVLLCVEDLQFSVGASKVAQLLMGHQTIFLTENGFLDNKMFGKLKQFSKLELVYIIKSLAVNKYLIVHEALNVFDVVSVSPKGYSLIEGRRKLNFHFLDTICSTNVSPYDEADKQFLHALKDLRISLAMNDTGKAYDICDDVTLIKIAHNRPADINALKSIEGINKVFVEKYGDAIIDTRTKNKDTAG